jgi:transcription antitermination factor NusG
MKKAEIDTLDTPVIVTDEREARHFCWYAARTQMNCERKVENRFQQIASETYLPTQEEIHQWSDRKKKVRRLVIPMVLFVKINRNEVSRVHVNKDNQFYGFITTDRAGRIPAEIPDKDIEKLRFMLSQSDSSVEISDIPYAAGDPVRVVRGPLRGLEGKIVKVNDRKGALIVPLNCLGSAMVSIDLVNVERLKVR